MTGSNQSGEIGFDVTIDTSNGSPEVGVGIDLGRRASADVMISGSGMSAAKSYHSMIMEHSLRRALVRDPNGVTGEFGAGLSIFWIDEEGRAE